MWLLAQYRPDGLTGTHNPIWEGLALMAGCCVCWPIFIAAICAGFILLRKMNQGPGDQNH